MICDAGSAEGVLDNSPLFCGKDISKSYIDYVDKQIMNGEAFESWFGNKLIPNLPKG